MSSILIVCYFLYIVLVILISYTQIQHIRNVKVHILNKKVFINEGGKLISIEKYRIFGILVKAIFLVLFSLYSYSIIGNLVSLKVCILIVLSTTYMVSLITRTLTQIKIKQKSTTKKRIEKYLLLLFKSDIFITLYIMSYPLVLLYFKYTKSPLELARYKTPIENIKLSKKLINICNEDIKLYMINERSRPAFVMKRKNTIEVFIGKKLVEMLNKDEVLSVIYHEVGHHKQNSIVLPLFITAYSVGVLYVFSAFFKTNIDLTNIFLLFDMSLFILLILYNFLKRQEEFQADRFSVEIIDNSVTLKNALRKGYEAYDKFPSSHFLFNMAYNRHPSLNYRIN